MRTQTSSRLTFAQIVVAIAGAVNLIAGAMLLLAPAWFFEAIGNFPPFNRHYMGDVGAFLLPLGVGLMIAAADPHRHRGLIGVAAAGSLLHVGNHLYDDFVIGQSSAHFVSETLPLLVLAILLIVAYGRLKVAATETRSLPSQTET